jgi:hypothetical protein
VIAVEPGAIATPAVEKTLGDIEKVIEDLPAKAQTQYGDILRSVARVAYRMEKSGSSPEVVARVILRALVSDRPRIRYRVGKHAKLLATLPKILPESVMDTIRIRMFGLRDGSSDSVQKPGGTRAAQGMAPTGPSIVNPK